VLKQKGILNYLPGNEDLKEDLFVNITFYKVPSDLVREFALKFAYKARAMMDWHQAFQC
jgi:hypothetical protein